MLPSPEQSEKWRDLVAVAEQHWPQPLAAALKRAFNTGKPDAWFRVVDVALRLLTAFTLADITSRRDLSEDELNLANTKGLPLGSRLATLGALSKALQPRERPFVEVRAWLEQPLDGKARRFRLEELVATRNAIKYESSALSQQFLELLFPVLHSLRWLSSYTLIQVVKSKRELGGRFSGSISSHRGAEGQGRVEHNLRWKGELLHDHVYLLDANASQALMLTPWLLIPTRDQGIALYEWVSNGKVHAQILPVATVPTTCELQALLHEASQARASWTASLEGLDHLQIPRRHRRQLRYSLCENNVHFPIETFPFFIGRDAKNSLVLNDPLVSRRHCELRLIQDTVLLDDYSRNGTRVDGQTQRQCRLYDGASLRMGSTELVFSIAIAEPNSRTQPFTRIAAQTPEKKAGTQAFFHWPAVYCSSWRPERRSGSFELQSLSSTSCQTYYVHLKDGAIQSAHQAKGSASFPELMRTLFGVGFTAFADGQLGWPKVLEVLTQVEATGLLTVQGLWTEGQLELQKGRLLAATLTNRDERIGSRALEVMLLWKNPGYIFEEGPLRANMHLGPPVQQLVRETFETIGVEHEQLPDTTADARLAHRLPDTLSKLTIPDLQLLEFAVNHDRLEAILGCCENLPESMRRVLRLRDAGWLELSSEVSGMYWPTWNGNMAIQRLPNAPLVLNRPISGLAELSREELDMLSAVLNDSELHLKNRHPRFQQCCLTLLKAGLLRPVQ
ncbi:MAG: FHA domain-containing protein [Myxococcota bacterium]|jgi:hypothetical protein|nr:FHA domain-containing protein [Myxococcota bacterium]